MTFAARMCSFLIVVLVLGAGATLFLQRQSAAELREEVRFLRDEQRDVARLVGENRQLAAGLPGTAELERLRSDHAALAHLQGEIQKLRDDLMARRRALAAGGK